MSLGEALRAFAKKHASQIRGLPKRRLATARPIFELTPLEERVLLSSVQAPFDLAHSGNLTGVTVDQIHYYRGPTVRGVATDVPEVSYLDFGFTVYTFNKWASDSISATVADGNGTTVGQAVWTFGNSWHIVVGGQDSEELHTQSYPARSDLSSEIFDPATNSLTDVDHDNDQLGQTTCGSDNIDDPQYRVDFQFVVNPATTNYSTFTVSFSGADSGDKQEYYGITDAEVGPPATCNCYVGLDNGNGRGGVSSTGDAPSSNGSGSNQTNTIDITDGNSNGLSAGSGLAGNDTVLGGVPSINVAPNQTAVVVDGYDTYWFDYNTSSSTWVERYNGTDTLTHPAGSYVLSDSGGTQTTFSDTSGLAQTITTPGGNATSFTYSGNLVTEIDRSSSVGGTTINEKVNYSYLPAGDPNAGKLEDISLQRQVGTGAWSRAASSNPS